MATPATITERIEPIMRVVRLELQDLPALEQDWSNLSKSNQASIHLEWEQLMTSHLPELQHHHDNGAMTSAQGARYLKLLVQLRAALPIIDRLRLRRPVIPGFDTQANTA